jgi:hypothetical protein
LLLFSAQVGDFLCTATVNQLAVYQLPKKLQPFFYQNLDTVCSKFLRPDQRRNSDPTEQQNILLILNIW